MAENRWKTDCDQETETCPVLCNTTETNINKEETETWPVLYSTTETNIMVFIYSLYARCQLGHSGP